MAESVNLLFCFVLRHQPVAAGARDQQKRNVWRSESALSVGPSVHPSPPPFLSCVPGCEPDP